MKTKKTTPANPVDLPRFVRTGFSACMNRHVSFARVDPDIIRKYCKLCGLELLPLGKFNAPRANADVCQPEGEKKA